MGQSVMGGALGKVEGATQVTFLILPLEQHWYQKYLLVKVNVVQNSALNVTCKYATKRNLRN